MTREEITNSQDYKATKAALDWWYSLPEEQRKATNIDAEPDIVDAYSDGVLYGWNNPNWIPVEEKLPKVDEQTTLSNDCIVVDSAGARYFGYYNGTDECWYTDDYTMILFVTHWMPLPQAPRKEE